MGVPSKTAKIIIVSIIALVIILVITAVFCLSGGDKKGKGNKTESKIPIKTPNRKRSNSMGAIAEPSQSEIILLSTPEPCTTKKKMIEKKKSI
ncbi:hypothetical protein NEIRO03_0013 [Nematocida sp. AWRm78]|nr:hypothetical protein NEIRO02_0001 [Nematocida sp. AWRm79]KAI5182329.1 hypothetical protein NEIRO03_0013 [Nematocida sp. AWRm78]